MKEIRLFGPPGTGKTTKMSLWIRQVVERHGSDAVLVASFTRAAAVELAGRDLPIERDRVATLHAHCYRLLGRPTIAEMHIDEFNQRSAAWQLSATKQNVDESLIDQHFDTPADAHMAQYQILRARLVPQEHWPFYIRSFAEVWEQWKAECGYIDFTDMIERVYRDVDAVPYAARFGFFDEAQDFTALEMALVRKWSKHMDYIVLAGDDDQTIFDFTGASPEAFLDPHLDVTVEKIVLDRSYRVPAAIHAYASRWVEQLTHREPKTYAPRDAVGSIQHLDARIYDWDLLLEDARPSLAQGKSLMFLTSCSYMLEHLIASLRDEGIPFHNPYRRTRGDWNPLAATRGISTVERILAYLQPEQLGTWTYGDLIAWTDLVKADGVFKRGFKTALAKHPPAELVDLGWLSTMMSVDDLHAAFHGDLVWLASHTLATKQSKLRFPLTIIEQQGIEALRRPPQVVVGTIHSVKGGEADVVYVFPDLSKAGMSEWLANGSGHDALVRLYYVAMTRARDTLVLCQPSSGNAIALPPIIERIAA